jgi:Fe-S cluster assembly scaffold protein SufB
MYKHVDLSTNFNELMELNVISDTQFTIKRKASLINEAISQKIVITAANPNIKIDLKMIFLIDSEVSIKEHIKIVAPEHFSNVSAKVTMRAIVFSPPNVEFIPELRIEQNNVDVDHFVAMGCLDKELVHYFETRGLTLQDIEHLLGIE